jgi:hypothetical protein
MIPINPPRFGRALMGKTTRRKPIPAIGTASPAVVVSPPRKALERATMAARATAQRFFTTETQRTLS